MMESLAKNYAGKVTKYQFDGKTHCEVTAWLITKNLMGNPYGLISEKPKLPDSRTAEEIQLENRERVLRRARKRARQLVLTIGADHIITLTRRENVCDVAPMLLAFEKFIARLKVQNPDFKYVACWERQKRGAIHFHIAVRGWQNIPMLRDAWLRVVPDGGLNVEAGKRLDDKNRTGRVASYITKYITKCLDDETLHASNRRTYRASHGIELDQERVFFNASNWTGIIGEALDKVMNISPSKTGKFGGKIWCCDDWTSVWICSWG